jgi:DNA-binding MarR family transcriptional regulator
MVKGRDNGPRGIAIPKRRPDSRISQDAERLLDLLNSLGSTTFRQLLWQKLSDLELTYAQSQVLFHVSDHPDCPMGEVAKAFAVTLPAVTQIVDRLEQKNLLARADHPTDRRVYVLDLTRHGRSVVQDLKSTRREAMEQVLRQVTPRERGRIVGGLEALVEAASRVHGTAP